MNTHDTEPDGFSAPCPPPNLNLNRLPWELGLPDPPPAALGYPAKPLLGPLQGPRALLSQCLQSACHRRPAGALGLGFEREGVRLTSGNRPDTGC